MGQRLTHATVPRPGSVAGAPPCQDTGPVSLSSDQRVVREDGAIWASEGWADGVPERSKITLLSTDSYRTRVLSSPPAYSCVMTRFRQ
jgi:hypothetical protein